MTISFHPFARTFLKWIPVFFLGVLIGVGTAALISARAPRPRTEAGRESAAVLSETTMTERSQETALQEATSTDQDESAERQTESLDIVWQEPKSVDAVRTFAKLATVAQKTFGRPADRETIDLLDASNIRIWETGIVKGGSFNGYKLHLAEMEEPTEIGMGILVRRRLLISPDGSLALILNADCAEQKFLCYRIDYYSFLKVAPNLDIPSVHLPEVLHTMQGKTLVRGEAFRMGADGRSSVSQRQTRGESFMTKEGIRLFQDTVEGRGGCLVAYTPDGEEFIYASAIPRDENGGIRVTWSAAGVTSTEYDPYTFGGCGGHGCVDILTKEEVGPLEGLQEVGRSADGESLYAPKDMLAHRQTQMQYEGWIGYDMSGEKPSLEAFLQAKPLPYFFWKDAFGRWTRYVFRGLQPPTECGKPVIYLYPEREMDVTVRLPLSVHITKSEPLYPEGGWSVRARPDGSLTMMDGASYGSLYWEGTGVGYAVPKDGFVVKDGEVEKFFTGTLPRYGLNERETREFMDFWVPKMSGAPYYRVSFLTSAWSQAAPLSVTPRPQRSIRLFMDWQRMSAPISIPKPAIVTPDRVGFTLVEWGGLLRP